MRWRRHPRKRAGFRASFSAAGDVAAGAGGDITGLGELLAFVLLGVWWGFVGIPQPHSQDQADAASPN